MDDLTELEDASVFKIKEKQTVSYEKEFVTQMDVLIEYDLNQTVIARDGYKFFDLLSDLGGMQSILKSGIAILVAILKYNMLDNFMVSRLYKQTKQKTSP